MLISELPQPYKALAENRRENNSDVIELAFNWDKTPEHKFDIFFWFWCDEAKNESELPRYPYPNFINEKGDYFIDFGDGSAEIKASDFKLGGHE